MILKCKILKGQDVKVNHRLGYYKTMQIATRYTTPQKLNCNAKTVHV